VLGGGDTAMDCLRTAVRLPGVAEVTCYYRRSETEMPAHHEDYTYAREEGAQFVWLTTPVNFTVDETGRLTGVTYQKIALGEPDPDGRRHPTPIPGSEFHVPAGPDPALLTKIEELKTHSKGLIIVDHQTTGRTNVPGILAAGDAVRGPDLLAPAIADARRVATALAEKLSA
jgi:NADPH-dependent glutamate synthase beta subunit-like oxidoreductase